MFIVLFLSHLKPLVRLKQTPVRFLPLVRFSCVVDVNTVAQFGPEQSEVVVLVQFVYGDTNSVHGTQKSRFGTLLEHFNQENKIQMCT